MQTYYKHREALLIDWLCVLMCKHHVVILVKLSQGIVNYVAILFTNVFLHSFPTYIFFICLCHTRLLGVLSNHIVGIEVAVIDYYMKCTIHANFAMYLIM